MPRVRYGLLLLVSAQILGILIADWTGPAPWLTALFGAVCAALYWIAPQAGAVRLVLGLAVALSAGTYSLAWPLERASGPVPPLPWDGTVEATVCGGTAGSNAGVSVVLCAARSLTGPGLLRAQADWVGAIVPDLLLRARTDSPEAERLAGLVAGQRIRAVLRLRAITGSRNPGGMDALRRARRRGIGLQARLLDAALLARLPARDTPTWARSGFGALRRRFSDLRRRAALGLIGGAVEQSETRRAGGALLAALAVGDRSGLPEDVRGAFARLGLAHLLAVSGLHLALVSGLSYRFVLFWASRVAGARPTRDRRPLALALAVLAGGSYAGWTGFGIPVQRAFIFLLILVPVWWMARRPPAAQGLALAAAVILAFSPASLFDLGARLSFVATAGLLLAARATGPASRSWTHAAGPVGTVTRGLRASAVALAVTAPLLAHAGLPVGPAGLLLNLVAVPWAALVVLPIALGASVAVIVTGPWSAPFVRLARGLAGWSVEVCVDLAEIWPLGLLAGPVALPVLVGVAGLALLTCRVAQTGRAVFLSLSLVVWLLGAPGVGSGPEVPRLVMFDVGQGDALLVQGRQAAVLVDGGRALAGGPDLGRIAVGPALLALGVRRLDAVVATHADVDHRGGLPHVLQNFEVGELWLPTAADPRSGFAVLRRLAESKAVPVRELGAGDPERVLGDLRFTPLWPPRHGSLESGNEGSLVLRAEVAGHRVLLTGDIGAHSERRLLAREVDLKADFLKVAHHGSAGSSTQVFLEAVDAEIALVSASCSGLSGLPSPRTLRSLERTGSSVWWTGRDGAVVVALGSRADGLAPTHVWGWGHSRVCRPGRPNAGPNGREPSPAPTMPNDHEPE